MAGVPALPNLKPIQQIKAPTEELNQIEDDFRNNVDILCNKMLVRADKIHAELSREGDMSMSFLKICINIIHNYLMNLTAKSHLVKGYIFRVYVSKDFIEKRDYEPILNDDEYLYGDFSAAKGFAPLIKRLFTEFLTPEQREETREFFITFNQLAEDWLIEEGVEKILLSTNRDIDGEDGVMLLKIKRAIMELEQNQADEELQENLFKILDDTRQEFGKLRDERVKNGSMYILAPPPNIKKPAAKKIDPKKDKKKKEERKKKAKEILDQSDSEEKEETKINSTNQEVEKYNNIRKNLKESIENIPSSSKLPPTQSTKKEPSEKDKEACKQIREFIGLPPKEQPKKEGSSNSKSTTNKKAEEIIDKTKKQIPVIKATTTTISKPISSVKQKDDSSSSYTDSSSYSEEEKEKPKKTIVTKKPVAKKVEITTKTNNKPVAKPKAPVKQKDDSSSSFYSSESEEEDDKRKKRPPTPTKKKAQTKK